MARETLPKSAPKRAANRVPWGNPNWGRTLENPEELIRMREGVVGDDGIRRVRMNKSDKQVNDRYVARFKRKGYEVTDGDYYFEFSIPQDVWESRQKARQAQDVARLKPQKKDRDFEIDEDSQLSPVSAADVLGE